MPEITVIQADPQGPEAMALLREAADEARKLYPELFDPDTPYPTNTPTPEGGIYVLALLRGTPVGMGAHRPLDRETTEIRRMFVSTGARRLGVARAVMVALERLAAEAGFRRLVLETGNRQLPAMTFYESYGFERIAPFGDYVNDPISVCYARIISGSEELGSSRHYRDTRQKKK